MSLKHSMWPQWFNLHFMKWQVYFLCSIKTKIITLFNNFFSFLSASCISSTLMHLKLITKDEQRSWLLNDLRVSKCRMFILWWTNPLRASLTYTVRQIQISNNLQYETHKNGLSRDIELPSISQFHEIPSVRGRVWAGFICGELRLMVYVTFNGSFLFHSLA